MVIKSVGVTFSILQAFVGRRAALTLKEIAYQSKLPPSKAHRYLRSLIQEGMIVQDPRTRLYGLGATAIALGLEALENTDPVVRACDTVRALAERLDVAVSIDVMGPAGPICIWAEQPVTRLVSPVRLGATQPLTASAAGQVFMAFLPMHATRDLVARETAMAQTGSAIDANAIAMGVRTRGYAALPPAPGSMTATIAAPVLDARGEACAAITVYCRPTETGGIADLTVGSLLSAANEASALKLHMRAARYAAAR